MSIITGGNYIPIKSNFNIIDELHKYFTFITKANYPKYNIIYIDANNIYIEIALAGFIKDNLKIMQNECEITIIGKDDVYQNNMLLPNKLYPKYLIKNISTRNFSLCFYLKPNISIVDVKFEHGMLYLSLHLKVVSNLNFIDIK